MSGAARSLSNCAAAPLAVKKLHLPLSNKASGGGQHHAEGKPEPRGIQPYLWKGVVPGTSIRTEASTATQGRF